MTHYDKSHKRTRLLYGFAPFYTTLFHILREQIVLAFIFLELLDFGASLSFCNGAY